MNEFLFREEEIVFAVNLGVTRRTILRFVEVNISGFWWFKKFSWLKGDLVMKMQLGS